jgi:hypothetical protein
MALFKVCAMFRSMFWIISKRIHTYVISHHRLKCIHISIYMYY